MVVEIVTEGLDVGDTCVTALGSQVTREKNYAELATTGNPVEMRETNTESNVTHFSFTRIVDTRHSFQLQWRVVPEQHLGGVLQNHTTFPGVHKFLMITLATTKTQAVANPD